MVAEVIQATSSEWLWCLKTIGHSYTLQYAHEELRGDREFMLQASEYVGASLQYASLGLKGDREFILQAVMHNSSALHYASLELKGDREFILQA
eukprot:1709376-Heterocapsa_arctica.AAC.1